MPPAKPQQEMPFAMAAIFAMIGGALLFGFLIGYVGPALWIRLAYEPVEATVVDRRLTSSSSGKGGTRYKLEVMVKYQVRDTACEGWAKLPLTTKDAPGPEMDAVLAQAQVGDAVTAFHDPIRPVGHVVLDRNQLEGQMIPAVLVPSLFLLVGFGGMYGSWRKTFPRGFRVDTANLIRRLPQRFYTSVLGAAVCVGAAIIVLLYLLPILGCGSVVLVGAAGFGAVVFGRRAARFGAVALASPERRMMDQQSTQPAIATAPEWNRVEPVTVDVGQHLPVRLRGNFLSDAIMGLGVAAGVVAVIVVAVFNNMLNPWRRQQAPEIRTITVLVPFALVGVGAFLAGRRVVRSLRALTVEVSDHPLRTGESYSLAVSHPDLTTLGQVQMEVVCEERSQTGKSTQKSVLHQLSVLLSDTVPVGAARIGRFTMPPGVPATLKLANHEIAWQLVASIGGTIKWKITFPVQVEAAAVAQPPLSAAGPTRLDDGLISVWLESESAVAAPCSLLRGGYAVRPGPNGPLRSVELSVLWRTPPPGVEEMGVCHYEDHPAVDGNDLLLYATRSFTARLPDGPLSHDGKAVVIRWAVRVRLRYAGGDEVVSELPFRLAPADCLPPPDAPPAQPDQAPSAAVPRRVELLPSGTVETIETPDGVCYRLPKPVGASLGFAPVLAAVAAVPLTAGVLAALFLVGNAAELSWPELILPWLFVAQMVFLALVPVRLLWWSLWEGTAQALGRFEIELRGDTLSWGWRVGPVRRASRRSVYEIRRLIVYVAHPTAIAAGAADSAGLAVECEGREPQILAGGYARSQISLLAEGLQKRLSVAGRPPPLETVDSDNPAGPATTTSADDWRRRRRRQWAVHVAGAVGLGVFTAAADHMGAWQPVRVRSFLIAAWLLEALVIVIMIFLPANAPVGRTEKPGP